MDTADLRARVVHLEESKLDHHHRLNAVEEWLRKKEITDGHQNEAWGKAIDDFRDRLAAIELKVVEKFTMLTTEFTGTKKDLSAIKKALWFVNGLILTGFVALLWKKGAGI